MPDTTSRGAAPTPPSFGRRPPAYISGRRLLAAAAVVHLALALGLHWAGRAQVAPALIDRDGIMGSFAFALLDMPDT